MNLDMSRSFYTVAGYRIYMIKILRLDIKYTSINFIFNS